MTYFARTIDTHLEDWSTEPGRKPLLLRGARQTGKTSSVRHLGASFELFLELNLERYADLALVRSCRSPDELLQALMARHNLLRLPARTLLFFDEIQERKEAVSWLPLFAEQRPEIAVIAAGSLMDVLLEERDLAFPTGSVSLLSMAPMTFFEFLRAQERLVLAKLLLSSAKAGAITTELHAADEEIVAQLVERLFVCPKLFCAGP